MCGRCPWMAAPTLRDSVFSGLVTPGNSDGQPGLKLRPRACLCLLGTWRLLCNNIHMRIAIFINLCSARFSSFPVRKMQLLFGWLCSSSPVGDFKCYPHSSKFSSCFEDRFLFVNLGVWVFGSIVVGAMGSPLLLDSKTGCVPQGSD